MGLKYLIIKIMKLQARLFRSYDRNLMHLLEVKAVNETVEYVSQKMQNAVGLKGDRHEMFDFALSKIKNEGSVLEFGVAGGYSINYIGKKLNNKQVYGFDTFEGLPEAWGGYFYGESTYTQYGKKPKVPDNVKLIIGLFEDTILKFKETNNQQIIFLHVDCDIYSSTKTIFDLIGDRIKKNTIILFDEYFGYPNWQNHEFKAFQEFIKSSGFSYEYLAFNGSFGVCVKITNTDNL